MTEIASYFNSSCNSERRVIYANSLNEARPRGGQLTRCVDVGDLQLLTPLLCCALGSREKTTESQADKSCYDIKRDLRGALTWAEKR